MKKTLLSIFILAFLIGLSLLNVSGGFAQPLELKAVSFLPKDHPLCAKAIDWVDRVNKEAKGELTVKYLGGPEVIPTFEQVEALRKEVVHINFNVAAYYKAMLPEGDAFHLSRVSFAEERKPGGFYDFMLERHNKLGIMYLGRWQYGPFNLWLKDPAKTLKDLAGRKLRTAALYDRFMKELGIIPVTIPQPDVYTSLERGMVEGFGWPMLGPRDYGWIEKCKYIIDYAFYPNMNATILMNLNVWNKLPKPLQTKLIGLTAKFESDVESYFKKEFEKEYEVVKQAGVKPIKFSPEEGKYYLDTAYRVEWEALEKKVPDLVPKLKQITGN